MNKIQTCTPDKKLSRVSQTDFPSLPLGQALKVAQGLWDHYAGKSAAPHNVALAIDVSPTSSAWRVLTGSSIAYGLTDGGYGASEISLTELGKRIVAPTSEGDNEAALQAAALSPRIAGEFFRQYDRAKFPREDIAANILIEKGIPKDRSAAAVALLIENGTQVGFIKQTKTGPFVSLDVPVGGVSALGKAHDSEEDGAEPREIVPENQYEPEAPPQAPGKTPPALSVAHVDPKNDKVFITHGKNLKILEQIKQVVELGGFVPVVSVQNETVAKPIPEKVMDDMRACGAAVIHVGAEGHLTDGEGKEHTHINPNVLIEIGAAMALYRGRFILVVEEGVTLPSNLSGLYESRYSGEGIQFDAGMKILKALRGLKDAE
jgi:hypothetical protein